MNCQKANFQDLLQIYYIGSPAQRGAEHLLESIKAKKHLYLSNLLRDFRRRSVISQREIRLRASVDALLLCYDIMEIAALVEFISPDDSNFWREAEKILGDAQVYRYYSIYYPTRLPLLLRMRLQGTHNVVLGKEHISSRKFLEFLDIDGRFMRSLNDGVLLQLLDSFVIEGYTFDDMIKILRSPRSFMKRIMLPPRKRGVLEKALYELSVFMEFCLDLSRLLKDLGDLPLLQSQMWNHYSYWFDIIGLELKGQLGKAFDQFLNWVPEEGEGKIDREIKRSISSSKEVLRELTSKRYSGPVKDLL